MTKYLTSIYAVIVLLFGLITLRYLDPLPVEVLRLKNFDLLQRVEPTIKSDNIVLLEVTEVSIQKYGQWPWSRERMADVVNRALQAGAAEVVLPIIFSETDRLGGDAKFARTISNKPVVLAQTATVQPAKPYAVGRGVAAIGDDPRPWLYSWAGAIAPIPELARSAAGVGIVASVPEVDGVTRRIPQLVYIQDKIYPSLGLEALRVAGGEVSYQVKTGDSGVQAVRIPQFGTVQTDSHGQVWVKWNNEFQRQDVTGEFANLKDKIVIIGITAEGLSNPVATPNGARAPHDVQAQILQTMINGTTIKRMDYADFAELALLLGFGIVLIVLVPRASLMYTLPVYVVYLAGVGLFGYISYTHYNTLWDMSWPIVAGTGVFMYLLFNKYAKELFLKLQIKKQFGTYLSPAMVEKLQKNPEMLQLGGESRELSIMFTDVRGFTSISEHYGKDVQGLTKIMNRYMTAMTAKIIENEGTLDKYIGDAQMAFWNAPLDDANHAKNAVRTGLQMMGSLDEFNREITAEGVPAFGMGLGINTDTVVVGNMGSSQRFDYTCLGDGVNLASRLEGQSKPYGVKIVIGAKTNEQVRDEYFTLELDCIAVKGKKEGVNIFTVLETDAGAMVDYLSTREHHDLMLQCYREQKWASAIKLINDNLKGEFDGQMDHYYDLWLERIGEMKNAKLPKDWDGVFRATSK
jgi:adenylate cyclase